ncbi:glycosyl transferase CpsO(V) [gamma proteobacterium HTCC5015]|nr:glycosyl transferase CpsO(V) [gamma proteobacterium HTCC5015]
MADKLLISILIPVKNEEKYIATCLRSVLEQSYSWFEALVIDDGSSDRTRDIVESFQDSRVKLLLNPRAGKVSAFNHGYSLSKGQAIIFLGGDDILPKMSLELRARAISMGGPKSQNICAYGQLAFLSEDEKYNGIRKPKDKTKGLRSGGTLILNRSMADCAFPIPGELPNEDTWVNICVNYLSCSVFEVPDVVLKYRIHEGNSHNRYLGFSHMNNFLHKRYLAYDIFYKSHRDSLSSSQRKEVQAIAAAEMLRWNGKSISILFNMPVPFKLKFSYFMNSSSFLYRLKLSFMRFLY